MVEPDFEKTSQKEFWLQILREVGEPGARAKVEELREGGLYQKKQEVAHNLAIAEYRELESADKPIRRDSRDVKPLEQGEKTYRQWWIGIGITAVAVVIAIATCSP